MVLLIQDLVHRQRYSTAGALKVLREQAEPPSALQADMFAPGRPQEIPETPHPADPSAATAPSSSVQDTGGTDSGVHAPSPAIPSPPQTLPVHPLLAESRRFVGDRGALSPQMRLELLTIRELLKQLRDLL